MENSTHDKILRACRNNEFKTRAKWGMRTRVLLGGWRTTEETACVVLDLERTKPHPNPKYYGFTVPIVLASGETWDEVWEKLVAAGEIADKKED